MISNYTRSLDEVSTIRPQHLAFLDELEARGLVVSAGMRNPPTGGVVLLATDDVDDAHALMADDPYAKAGYSIYQAVGWNPVRGVLADWAAH
ncbi:MULTISPECIES: YciI family protein [unclassified Saccharopolyspora]|uniref:YciI family protein n=1 Tax=unclassified Saccharopolyspora TaxID=2646250 RepID=UPI001CD5B446|nr:MULTISPECIES: YciI family protein [unclassified Saccharopolyspora]MCA1186987.1 YciI family protein [Saccharopolyspora sp. 6T]MCA1192634.1 YciI family protein [Saccharopolyspora sp. 6V]MCA1229634.1 YciI family protein [Saccharopolyspora sp. 6M]MCA1283464.1 YciI family protein [Saccharopolyspora sp. 7B]